MCPGAGDKAEPTAKRRRVLGDCAGRGHQRSLPQATVSRVTDINVQEPDVQACKEKGAISDGVNLEFGCSPTDCFLHFVGGDILNIQQETNLHASRKILQARRVGSLTAGSRLNEWKQVTLLDIRKFLAIIFHMSISSRTEMQFHWSKDPCVSCNFCPNIMGRNRFLSILSNFCLRDSSTQPKKGEPGYNPLFKVRLLADKVRQKFQESYQPDENVTVDEGMCTIRGRLSFKRQMLKRPTVNGLKLFMVSESSTGYIWNFNVFSGENSSVGVVNNLLENLKKIQVQTFVVTNKRKNAGDVSLQRLSYGAFEPPSVKWWKKLTFHILLMAIANASVLYNKINNKKLSITRFIKDLSKNLSVDIVPPAPHVTDVEVKPPAKLENSKHFLERIPLLPGKRKIQYKRCKVCAMKGKQETGRSARKDTAYQCSDCKIPMCKTPCFRDYHLENKYFCQITVVPGSLW